MANKIIKSINPVARAMLKERKPKQVVQPKKGKGSYDRKKSKAISFQNLNFDTKSDWAIIHPLN